jgi:threonine dehydratase
MDSGGNGFLHSVLTSRVYDVARETPLDPAPRLSRRLGHQVLLKREDLQPTTRSRTWTRPSGRAA